MGQRRLRHSNQSPEAGQTYAVALVRVVRGVLKLIGPRSRLGATARRAVLATVAAIRQNGRLEAEIVSTLLRILQIPRARHFVEALLALHAIPTFQVAVLEVLGPAAATRWTQVRFVLVRLSWGTAMASG